MKNTVLITSFLLGGTSLVAHADEITEETTLDTVKVSADFRELDLQQIPSAITVVGEDAIQNRNADHLESILSLAPNVNFSSGASRGRYFQIRGIGERSQFIDPVNPSVGLIIDGIDMTGLGGAATLFDIEQVEILRGPQGTAFGANALAGAINIKSKQPTKETEGYIEAKAGNYNSQGLGGAISGSLVDNVQARFAINQFKTDGYMKNIHLNRDDTNNIDETVARAQIAWQINDLNDINVSILKTDINNGYDAFSLDNTRTTYSDEPGRDTQDSQAFSFIFNSSELEIANLLIQTTYNQSDIEYAYDEDWSYVGIHADEYSSTDEYLRNYDRSSFEVRLTSKHEGSIFNGSTNWTLGLYQNNRKEDLTRNYTWTGTFNSELKHSSTSLYSELNTNLSEDMSLTYGIRIESSSIDYLDSGDTTGEINETMWGGKITLDKLLSYQHVAYVSVARGYKTGGVNSDPDVSEDFRTFDTEINHTIEAGVKSSLLDDQLTTRIATFYTQRLDMQAKSSYSIQNPDMSFTFQDYLTNAAEGRNIGIELESEWKVSPSVTWNTSLGYLNTEFIEYTYETDDGITNKTGREQAHSPLWSLSTSTQIRFAKAFNFIIEVEGKDDFYFSDSHDEKSQAYHLVHVKLEYTNNNLALSASGRNLTNQTYSTRGFGFGNDPRDGYSDTQHIQLGDPRLITLNARYSF